MLDQQRIASGLVGSVTAGRNLNEAMALAFRQAPGLSPQDRAAIQDLSFGTLRHLGRLRAVLAQLVRQPPQPKIEHLLLVALYQLEYSRSAPYAVVDHAVELAGALSRGKAGGFVNACLRRYQREREALLRHADARPEERWSFPRWWVDEMTRSYPQCWQDILEHSNAHPPMTLRVNRRHGSGAQYLDRLREQGLEGELLGEQAVRLAVPAAVDKLPGFFEGHASVQDWGAQQAAALLDARDGQRVLDACAAPGGKTGHILELAHVELLALDSDAARLRKVKQNLERLRLEAEVRQGDAGRPAEWWDGRPFDRILADVPCSASGVVRRHPDIKWLRRPEDIDRFREQQAVILRALWDCLAPGGRIVYSTCSIFGQENEQQIDAFMQQQTQACRIDPMITGMFAGQLLPDDRHDGFYYAVLEKPH